MCVHVCVCVVCVWCVCGVCVCVCGVCVCGVCVCVCVRAVPLLNTLYYIKCIGTGDFLNKTSPDSHMMTPCAPNNGR